MEDQVVLGDPKAKTSRLILTVQPRSVVSIFVVLEWFYVHMAYMGRIQATYFSNERRCLLFGRNNGNVFFFFCRFLLIFTCLGGRRSYLRRLGGVCKTEVTCVVGLINQVIHNPVQK